jgi:hypothetical protein
MTTYLRSIVTAKNGITLLLKEMLYLWMGQNLPQGEN